MSHRSNCINTIIKRLFMSFNLASSCAFEAAQILDCSRSDLKHTTATLILEPSIRIKLYQWNIFQYNRDPIIGHDQ